jgi:Spy/CpxP family protein refolding chaperone
MAAICKDLSFVQISSVSKARSVFSRRAKNSAGSEVLSFLSFFFELGNAFAKKRNARMMNVCLRPGKREAMKQMTQSLAVLALLAIFAAPATAQDQPKPPAAPEAEKPEAPKPPKEERPEGRRPRERGQEGQRPRRQRGGMGSMEELGLSPEQKEKIEAAGKDYQDAMAEARESRDWNLMRDARQKLQKTVESVLTAEQKKKRDEANRNRFGGGQGRGGFGRSGEGGERRGGRGRRQSPEQREATLLEEIKKSLFLGKTQETGVIASIKNVQTARRSARDTLEKKRGAFLASLKKGLTKEQSKATLTAFRKARDESKATIEKAQEELSKQLDEEQRAKLVAFGILN